MNGGGGEGKKRKWVWPVVQVDTFVDLEVQSGSIHKVGVEWEGGRGEKEDGFGQLLRWETFLDLEQSRVAASTSS